MPAAGGGAWQRANISVACGVGRLQVHSVLHCVSQGSLQNAGTVQKTSESQKNNKTDQNACGIIATAEHSMQYEHPCFRGESHFRGRKTLILLPEFWRL